MMKIAGLVKSSIIDYPGKIAAVVFTQGCNFRCGFCHNPDLLDFAAKETISEDEFFKFLADRVGLIDGIVITGGEPTLQSDLHRFIEKIKKLGFAVKLDTNGSHPVLLNALIEHKLLDYIAMDIKGALESYQKIAAYKNTENILKSIELIKTSGVDYEFRTTVLPYYHKIADFEQVGQMIKDAKAYTIQGFRSEITYKQELRSEKPFSNDELSKIASLVEKYVKTVKILVNN